MYSTAAIDQFLSHPAKGPSIVFATLFTISGGLHVWQSRKYKSWPYTWPLPCACILIIAAFILVEYSARHPHGANEASAVQGLFYSAAPTFTLPLYTYLLHLLDTRPKLVRIRPTYFMVAISCFNTAIITCIGNGASTYFSPGQHANMVTSGLRLVKASLLLQLIVNTAFVSLLILLQHRQNIGYHCRDRRTTIVMLTLYALMGLILVRNVFRTVQIFVPPSSPLWTAGVFFWVFEACVMLVYTTLFHVMHPAKYLTGRCWSRRRECSGEDGEMQHGCNYTR